MSPCKELPNKITPYGELSFKKKKVLPNRLQPLSILEPIKLSHVRYESLTVSRTHAQTVMPGTHRSIEATSPVEYRSSPTSEMRISKEKARKLLILAQVIKQLN